MNCDLIRRRTAQTGMVLTDGAASPPAPELSKS